jgi:alkylated DNA repair dioxygenase AlkB
MKRTKSINETKHSKRAKRNSLFDISLVPGVEHFRNFMKDDTPQFDDILDWTRQAFKFYTWKFMGKTGDKKRKECFVSLCSNERKVASYTYGSSTYTANHITTFDKGLQVFVDDFWLRISQELDLDVNNPPNGIFCNLYNDKSHVIPYHSDNEPSMDKNKPIISISFGGERVFNFCPRFKSKKCIAKVLLQHGDVCIMKPGTQEKYRHGISKGSEESRINFTFRWFV